MINDHHPLYDEHVRDWVKLRDVYAGARRVKRGPRAYEYLPPTESQRRDGAQSGFSSTGNYPWSGTDGERRYYAYKARALFYDFMLEGVRAALGLMHHKPAVFELPKSMEKLLTRATTRGESLQFLLSRITEEQLIAGRVGILLDLPKTLEQQPRPFLSIYQAERIINWDDGECDDSLVVPKLNLVVLDESGYRRTDYSWSAVERHRALILGDAAENEPSGAYTQVLYGEDGEESRISPSVRGKTLDEIPFVFVNAQDHAAEPDDPPFLGLADMALTIYRGDADYRHNLFLQSVKTLVTIGASFEDDQKPIEIGPEAHIPLPLGADAKWVGPSSDGLEQQRKALEDDKMLAAMRAGQVVDTRGGQREGAETLRIRASGQTATLGSIAHAAAGGVQEVLRIYARWLGEDPEKVIVTPNLDFHAEKMSAEDLVKYVTAKTLGAPLSKRSLHNLMRQGEVTSMTYEEEEAELEGEPDMPSADEEVEDDAPEDDEPDEGDE